MDKHTQRHDTFIRAIMANQQIALDYFQACIPKHILDMLDFSTFRQLPDTYVSKDLQKSISDIVYTCRRANGKGEVKISLLVEHKSYIDKYTPIQIGSYLFSGLLKQIGNGEVPSLIIPILLYHGKARWKYKTLADLFGPLEPALQGFVPDYQYIFHNLGQISDDEIQKLHNKFLAASLLAMKHSAFKDQLNALLPTILTLASEMEKNLQKSLVVYTLVGSDLSDEQIFELITSIPNQNNETIMNTLEMLIERGRKEGIAEAFAEAEKKTQNSVRNLIKQSMLTDEQIASAMDLPVNYVVEIRELMASEL
jgi:predicted transposase/invertase (TIGR01784 family)